MTFAVNQILHLPHVMYPEESPFFAHIFTFPTTGLDKSLMNAHRPLLPGAHLGSANVALPVQPLHPLPQF